MFASSRFKIRFRKIFEPDVDPKNFGSDLILVLYQNHFKNHKFVEKLPTTGILAYFLLFSSNQFENNYNHWLIASFFIFVVLYLLLINRYTVPVVFYLNRTPAKGSGGVHCTLYKGCPLLL